MKKILAFVPLPPPFAGPEIATQALLENLNLEKVGSIRVVKSNVRASNAAKGKLDFAGMWGAAQALLRFFVACLRYRPDGIYFLLSSSKIGFLRDFFVILIARLFFCKVVAHYHGSNFKNFYQGQSRGYQWLIKLGLKGIDTVIVLGESLKPIFSELRPSLRVEVLYNGLSEEILERGANLKCKEKRGEIFLLFLNHICFFKGFYDLVLAFEKILAQGKNVRLLVAGDLMLNAKTQWEFLSGDVRLFYEENFRPIHQKIVSFLEQKHNGNVRYLGVVEDAEKYRLYEQADIFILPSYTEGLPYSILEALAFGMPLIISPVGALREILKEGENALFVTPGDQPMLARQINRLLADPLLRKNMGEANYRLAREFQIDRIQKKFLNILYHERL